MMIDDITRNKYCFTDGNGFISKGLAKHIAETLAINPKNVGFVYRRKNLFDNYFYFEDFSIGLSNPNGWL